MTDGAAAHKKEHEELLKTIWDALGKSDRLSQNENDKYAKCSSLLHEAFYYLQGLDSE